MPQCAEDSGPANAEVRRPWCDLDTLGSWWPAVPRGIVAHATSEHSRGN